MQTSNSATASAVSKCLIHLKFHYHLLFLQTPMFPVFSSLSLDSKNKFPNLNFNGISPMQMSFHKCMLLLVYHYLISMMLSLKTNRQHIAPLTNLFSPSSNLPLSHMSLCHRESNLPISISLTLINFSDTN
jgi:hypothetical protein